MGKNLVVDSFFEKNERFLKARKISAVDELTHRECEIARAYASGQTYKEIGRYCGISPSTVSNHLTAIFKKLGICDKAELALLFARYD